MPMKSITIIVAFSAWAVTMGVSAGLWSIRPAVGWAVFAVLICAWAWVAWVVARYLLEIAAAHGYGNALVCRTGGVLASMITAVFFISSFDLPSLTPSNCEPKFEWRKEKKRGFDNSVSAPYLIRFANIVPRSEKPYAMNITANGGGLLKFYVDHVGRRNDPPPWQLEPSGIAYKAINPTFTVGIFIAAREPDKVKLDHKFECIKNGTKRD